MPQIDLTTYIPLLFWILLILVVFFKFLISQGALNFLNLPKLQGNLAMTLSNRIYNKSTLLQTKYLVF
jgi:hypothetical protein